MSVCWSNRHAAWTRWRATRPAESVFKGLKQASPELDWTSATAQIGRWKLTARVVGVSVVSLYF